MANAHPDEKEFYDRIRRDEIKVPLHIWDMMYHYIGDNITAITQIAQSYCGYGEPIEISAARKILEHTARIRMIVGKILHPETIDEKEQIAELEILKDSEKLHPVIRELFTHYIGNDVHGINMIVEFHLDPLDEGPIPVENGQKILNKTQTMKQFLDRLSAATNQEIRLSE